MKKAKRDFEKKLAKNAKKNSKMFLSYMKQKTANKVTVGPLVRHNAIFHVICSYTLKGLFLAFCVFSA